MKPVFVLGPHRSGTSLLTRLLNLCGRQVGSPESLLPPTSDNEGGYWESRWLVDHNDLLLGIFGGDWRSCPPIDVESLPQDLLTGLVDRASGWANAMDRGGAWVAKDPRLCLTAGFWQRVRPGAAWVLGLRHPAAAVASLVHRRGDRVQSREEALALWRRHIAAAVRFTEGKQPLVVDYDALLGDSAKVRARLVSWLRELDPAYVLPGDLAELVDGEIDPRRRRHLAQHLPDGFCQAADVAVHEALLRGDVAGAAEQVREWPTETARFDNLEFVERYGTARGEIRRLSAEVQRRNSELSHLRSRLEHSDTLIRQSEPTLSRREVELERARREVVSLKRSWSYRVGRVIVSPASLFKTLARRIGDPASGMDEFSDDAASYRLLARKPSISIVLAVRDAPAESVQRTVDTVLAQSYPDWRLSIAVGGSAGAGTFHLLERLQRQERITVVRSKGESNAGSALAAALEAGAGEFVAPLEAGDLLEPAALLEMALRLDAAPDEIDMVYSDEETIAPDGTTGIYRKPDFSPELLLSSDYLHRLVLLRRSVVDEVGGFRGGFDGDAIFDLFLRAGEQARRVEHVPQVLCRQAVGAPAIGGGTGKAALESAIGRRGLDGEVEDGLFAGSYRVRFAVPDSLGVTIIIPTAGNAPLLQRCIESIRRQTSHPRYEILVICNNCEERAVFEYLATASKQGTLRYLEHDIPFNFAKLNNHAVRHSTNPYLLFLNDDVEATHDGWLRGMLEYAQQKPIGVVGARLLYPDRTVQHAGMVLGIMGGVGHVHRGLPVEQPGYFGAAAVVRNCSAVTGACMMTRRELFDRLGGFTESFPTAFNDVDYCLKVRDRGHRVVYTPHATLYHHESRTRGRDDSPASTARHRTELGLMLKTWDERLLRDPYYNPHLTLWNEDFSTLTAHDTRLNDEYYRLLRTETGLD